MFCPPQFLRCPSVLEKLWRACSKNSEDYWKKVSFWRDTLKYPTLHTDFLDLVASSWANFDISSSNDRIKSLWYFILQSPKISEMEGDVQKDR